MQINTIAGHLQKVIYNFVEHKDFTKEGNLAFKQKQRQLIEFGNSSSPNVLRACFLLLQNDDNQQVRFFTTMIIKDALKYSFYELDEGQVADTHAQLVTLIQKIANPSKPVLSNLALCLVYLYIHCIDKIGSVMQFFSATFPNDGNTTQGSRFLYFFKYMEMLPEEAHSQRLVIDEEARAHVLNLLKCQQTEILTEMHNVYSNFSASNMTMLEKAVLIDAFSNWLELTVPDATIIASLPAHSIMNLAISSFNNDHLSAPSMRCLMSAVSIMRNPDQNEQLFKFLGKNLFSLMSEVDSQIKEELYEPAENLIHVLCDYGSYSASKFIEGYNADIQQFIVKMLHFTELEDLDVFKGLIDFWECLIYQMTHRTPESTMSQEVGYQIIAKIYTVFCSRIQFTNQEIEDLNELSESQLEKLHKNIEDTIDRREESRYIFEKIASYLGQKAFVKEVYHAISGLNPVDKKYWPTVEAHIYSLRDATKDYPGPTEQICQTVLLMETMKNMPTAVKKSFLRVFETLFTIKQKNEEFILRILTYVSSMFPDKLLQSKADKAFTRCCQNNAKILIKHLPALFSLFEMYPESEEIINGIIMVLRGYPDILSQHIPELLKIPYTKLVQAQNRLSKKIAFSNLITLLTSIPSGEGAGNEALLQDFLQQMWPYISEILKNPQDNQGQTNSLLEKSTTFLKRVMRKIPNQFMKYLKDIFDVMLGTYRNYPIGPYLYFFEATFATYYQSTSQQMYEFLKNTYIEYCNITALHFKNKNVISENQRLVDDFIGLNKRLITFHLRMFLESGQFEFTLQFSMNCLGSNVPRAANTASQMFEVIFMIYWSQYSRKKWEDEDLGEAFKWKAEDVELYNQLKDFLIPLVSNLIIQMFNYLMCGKADTATNNIVDCLMAVALAFPDKSQQIWIQPLQSLGEDILTRTQKQRLLNSLQAMGSNSHDQFLTAQSQTKKLLDLISRRFRNRMGRSKLQKH